MLLRPILSRLQKHQSPPNFWFRKNGAATLTSEKNSNAEEKPLDKRYVVSYLVNSCGLSPEKATSVSKSVHFDGPDKPDAVVKFLAKLGFTKSQIGNLVVKAPVILVYNPEKSLMPKFEFLSRSTGISETEIPAVVSKSPYILTRSIVRRVAPVYNYLKGIIGAEKVDKLIRRGSWIFNVDLKNKIEPNVDLLREVGVPQQFIEFAFVNCTLTFSADPVKFKKLVDEVKEMGFDPLKSTFVIAMKARSVGSCLALWNISLEVYRKWGWSEEEIQKAFIKHPGCMLLSEKKISKALDFLVNKLGREASSVARNPQILFYSMEKRIVPRCSVVQLLSSKGLVEKDWCLTSVLCTTEGKFIDKYVTRYIETMPQLNDVYLSKIGSGANA